MALGLSVYYMMFSHVQPWDDDLDIFISGVTRSPTKFLQLRSADLVHKGMIGMVSKRLKLIHAFDLGEATINHPIGWLRMVVW